ncbi:hypothetical protein [Streptomyces sp. SID8352]|uniref:hypothetical protein n=1 Tax=Streptomyces sp. SID8352 TaxID=2690338 RepID=UPI0019262D94|nr:hypothetical protein [Streptomyces sp. SID8352]
MGGFACPSAVLEGGGHLRGGGFQGLAGPLHRVDIGTGLRLQEGAVLLAVAERLRVWP